MTSESLIAITVGDAARHAMLGRMSNLHDTREQRLAEALRANLRRRKAQARGEDAAPPRPAPDPDKPTD